ncbi:rubredoxin [Fusobacterium sp. MFO224]|uniref:rubredoxin n=1 Tax=Fusobacterium sp. MFO224 TaxID=3378070 RepID=UPI0038541187
MKKIITVFLLVLSIGCIGEKKTMAKEIKETITNEKVIEKWKCSVCGYVYNSKKGDRKNGIKPGTKFSELPEDWVCPVCGATKDKFKPL